MMIGRKTSICLFRLSYTEELQCTILEVKAIGGFGTTIDVCLVNGRLKFGQTIVLPGTDGPIVTTVKVSEACWRNVHMMDYFVRLFLHLLKCKTCV